MIPEGEDPEVALKRIQGMIDSMTKEERRNPDIIDHEPPPPHRRRQRHRAARDQAVPRPVRPGPHADAADGQDEHLGADEDDDRPGQDGRVHARGRTCSRPKVGTGHRKSAKERAEERKKKRKKDKRSDKQSADQRASATQRDEPAGHSHRARSDCCRLIADRQRWSRGSSHSHEEDGAEAPPLTSASWPSTAASRATAG